MPLTFKGVSIEHISTRTLIDFRKREDRANGSEYQKLRHNYVDAISAHIKNISKYTANSKDRIEVDRVFEQKMDTDLSDLKQELGFSKKEAWFSKEVVALAAIGAGVAASAAAGHLVVPEVIAGAGGVVTIGGLLGAHNKLSRSRYDTLSKHPMAYLYQLDSSR